MRIIVTGDGNFEDKELLFKKLDAITIKLDKVELAFSGQKTYLGKSRYRIGVEYYASLWCAKWRNPYCVYHVYTFFQGDKKKKGNEKRLQQMFRDSQAAVIFWNETNKETERLIEMANKIIGRKKVRLIRYQE